MATKRRGPGSRLGISESESKCRKIQQDKTHQQRVNRISLAGAYDEFQTLRQQCGFLNSKPAVFVKHLVSLHNSSSTCVRRPTTSTTTRDEDQTSEPEYMYQEYRNSICSPPCLTRITAGSKPLRSCIGFHGWKDICFSEGLVKEITGVSIEVFNLLQMQLPSIHPTFGGLTRENSLLAFLMKLKMNTPFSHLAAQMSVPQSTVEQTFMFVLLTLAELTSTMIQWPSKTTVRRTLPPFIQRSFPRCRLIIDCLEMETEAPPDLGHQRLMISSVNSAFGARAIIGLTPNGYVCFVSKVISGNISQAILSKEGSLLYALEVGDEIISLQAERWSMPIKGIELHTAPITPMLPKWNPRYRDDAAALNSHFDKLKQRLSSFAILRSKIPLSLLPHIDTLLHVCAVLSNFDEDTPSKHLPIYI